MRAEEAAEVFAFSTTLPKQSSQSCDEQPLPRILNAHNGTVRVIQEKSATTSASVFRGEIRAANSLFWNILRTTPCESIFCRRTPLSRQSQPQQNQDFAPMDEKKFRSMSPSFKCGGKAIGSPGSPEPIVYNLPSIAKNEKDTIGTRRPYLQPAPREIETD